MSRWNVDGIAQQCSRRFLGWDCLQVAPKKRLRDKLELGLLDGLGDFERGPHALLEMGWQPMPQPFANLLDIAVPDVCG
jgi:hypothetical protein